MHDVKAVDWLPLDDAVERLSRGYERAFLDNVGPLAVEAAAHAFARRSGGTGAREASPGLSQLYRPIVEGRLRPKLIRRALAGDRRSSLILAKLREWLAPRADLTGPRAYSPPRNGRDRVRHSLRAASSGR